MPTDPQTTNERDDLIKEMVKFIEEVLTCKTNDEWLRGEELSSKARKLIGEFP